MRILLLILVAISAIPCYGQMNGWVCDENKNPIRYASIIILDEQKRGTATDEKGFFSIDTKSIARLYVSSVGFYDTIIPASSLKQDMKIVLKTRTYMLPEVVVTSSNLKPIVLGVFKTTPTKETIRPVGQIFDVLPELVRFQADKPGWYEIDLSEYDVVVPEHGFFLFIEALERVEKYQWWKYENGNALYGAWVSNNPTDYKPFELALINIDKDRPGYYILKSPLLRNSKPMILITLK